MDKATFVYEKLAAGVMERLGNEFIGAAINLDRPTAAVRAAKKRFRVAKKGTSNISDVGEDLARRRFWNSSPKKGNSINKVEKIEPKSQVKEVEPKSQVEKIEPKSQIKEVEPKSQIKEVEPKSQVGEVEPKSQVGEAELKPQVGEAELKPRIEKEKNTFEAQVERGIAEAQAKAGKSEEIKLEGTKAPDTKEDTIFEKAKRLVRSHPYRATAGGFVAGGVAGGIGGTMLGGRN